MIFFIFKKPGVKNDSSNFILYALFSLIYNINRILIIGIFDFINFRTSWPRLRHLKIRKLQYAKIQF